MTQTQSVKSLDELYKLVPIRVPPARPGGEPKGFDRARSPFIMNHILSFIALYQKTNRAQTPPVDAIANEVGLDRQSVLTYLHRLEDWGWIDITMRAPLKIMIMRPERVQPLDMAQRLHDAARPERRKMGTATDRYLAADARRMQLGRYIAEVWAEKGRGPSIKEMMDRMGTGSAGTISSMLDNLEGRHLITRRHGVPGSTMLTREGEITFGLKPSEEVRGSVFNLPPPNGSGKKVVNVPESAGRAPDPPQLTKKEDSMNTQTMERTSSAPAIPLPKKVETVVVVRDREKNAGARKDWKKKTRLVNMVPDAVRFIARYIAEHGVAPMVGEVGAYLGYAPDKRNPDVHKCPGGSKVLSKAAEMGYIEHVYKSQRKTRLTAEGERLFGIAAQGLTPKKEEPMQQIEAHIPQPPQAGDLIGAGTYAIPTPSIEAAGLREEVKHLKEKNLQLALEISSLRNENLQLLQQEHPVAGSLSLKDMHAADLVVELIERGYTVSKR